MNRNNSQMISNSMTALIVEDNAVNMLLVKCILENIMPHAIICEAENGLIAVEKCKTAHPDIIFMDVRMPVKNGYEATKEIRKLDLQRKIPIIALTAGTNVGERERCLEAGMDDYISKPITQGAIEVAITNWLLQASDNLPKDQKLDQEPEEMHELVHYNEVELRSRLKNREELVQKVLRAAKTGMDSCARELHQQLKEEDFFSVMETAHKLKGMAMSACFDELAKLAAELEELCKTEYKSLGAKMAAVDSEIRLIKILII